MVRKELQEMKDVGCGMVVVVIDRDGDQYASVKREAEITVSDIIIIISCTHFPGIYDRRTFVIYFSINIFVFHLRWESSLNA